jgi:UDPglucose--hexose-1-phosphate uridylyltransferase
VLFTEPHRRYNPLLDEWVLCSPHRLARPWLGQIEATPRDDLPAYDPSCYLCPGNVRANGARNPPYSSTFAFDNDFPALLPDTGAEAHDEDGLILAAPVRGVCRVICFSPRHDLSLGEMETREIRLVVDAWAHEIDALASRRCFRYVQVFENKGAVMGASNPHPHCQVWATDHVPLLPTRKLDAQRRYFVTHGRDLLGDYLAREISREERIVYRNEHWTVLVPFWAVWPFETMIVPTRRVADLRLLEAEERDALAASLKDLNRRYDALFSTPFPYSMGWHGAAIDDDAPEWVRLHAVYFPPLLRSATVRKFLVGYELTAEPQRDLTAEAAAARLRECLAQRATEGAQGDSPP